MHDGLHPMQTVVLQQLVEKNSNLIALRIFQAHFQV